MKQRDWVKEWETREEWVVFDQGGNCYGQVIGEEFRGSKYVLLVRCRCDMDKARPQATNFIERKNIVSKHSSFQEAENAYRKKYLNK